MTSDAGTRRVVGLFGAGAATPRGRQGHGPPAVPLSAWRSHDPAMRRALERIRLAAPTSVPVLVTGEAGTGKETLAHALHALGPRASHPLVTLDLAGLPEGRVAAELLGAEPGAFLGARAGHYGALERASDGTLVLRGVEALAPEGQALLRRVLADGRFQRLGGAQPIPVRARVVTLAQADLARAVEEGSLRADLLHALALLHVHVPPLRERGADLEDLARALLRQAALVLEMEEMPALTPDAVVALAGLPWPGNVRELGSVMMRLALAAEDGAVDAAQVRRELGLDPPAGVPAGAVRGDLRPANDDARAPTLDETIARAIADAVEVTGGDAGEAARLLGISRATVYRWLRKAGEGSP